MNKEWRELEVFKGIDLNDSFVLDWRHESGRLIFELEASIWPESIYYKKPKESEFTCYLNATLVFNNISNVIGLKRKSVVNSSVDPDCSVDYGNIDSFRVTNEGFQISGDFGFVNVVGGELSFEVHT